MEHQFVQNGELKLHQIIRGAVATDPTILIIPGMDEAAEDRSYLSLDERLQTIILSVRGRGQSSSPTSGYKLADQASDVEACISSDRKFILVGISAGAAFALRAAVRRASNIAAVVVADFPPFYPRYASKWAASARSKQHGQMNDVSIDGVVADNEWVDLDAELTTLSFPIVVIHGDQDDAILNEDYLDRYRKACKDCRIHKVKGSGHDVLGPYSKGIDVVRTEIDRLLSGSASL
jgi:pimeloyl-ACP methyl ester carboxylesterase